MEEKVPMTKQGYQNLNEELKHLKFEERPRIVAAIEEARGHGDLSENAEYHSAREQQSFIEGRIQELEGALSHAQVIDTATLSGDKVLFGAGSRRRVDIFLQCRSISRALILTGRALWGIIWQSQ